MVIRGYRSEAYKKSDLKPSTIAIDGPGGVGKNAVGGLLAKRLGYRFLDTGAMYRALTVKAIDENINLEDEEELYRLALRTNIEFHDADLGNSPECPVSVDNRDVTAELHRTEVDAGVSLVSKVAGVRKILVAKQRAMAQGGRIVMVGRDIGTTVLPDADLKIFLVASPEERARRRYLQMQQQGIDAGYGYILNDLRRRDSIDSQREVSPLRAAEDAKVIDTEGKGIEQVVDEILKYIDQKSCGCSIKVPH